MLGDTLYFVATGDDSKRTLWRSDGTTAGTGRVVGAAGAPATSDALRAIGGLLYFPRGVVQAGSRLYLSTYKPGTGNELWSAQTQRYVYLALTRR